MITRRSALRGATAIVPLAVLAACANGSPTAAQIEADVQAIGAGFQGFIAALTAAVPNIPASVLQNATTAVQAVETNAAAIAVAIEGGAAVKSLASAFLALENAVTLLDTILTPYFKQAPAIAAVVQAGLALLQIILAAAGLTPAPAPTPTVMSEAQARAFLNSKPLVK